MEMFNFTSGDGGTGGEGTGSNQYLIDYFALTLVTGIVIAVTTLVNLFWTAINATGNLNSGWNGATTMFRARNGTLTGAKGQYLSTVQQNAAVVKKVERNEGVFTYSRRWEVRLKDADDQELPQNYVVINTADFSDDDSELNSAKGTGGSTGASDRLRRRRMVREELNENQRNALDALERERGLKQIDVTYTFKVNVVRMAAMSGDYHVAVTAFPADQSTGGPFYTDLAAELQVLPESRSGTNGNGLNVIVNGITLCFSMTATGGPYFSLMGEQRKTQDTSYVTIWGDGTVEDGIGPCFGRGQAAALACYAPEDPPRDTLKLLRDELEKAQVQAQMQTLLENRWKGLQTRFGNSAKRLVSDSARDSFIAKVQRFEASVTEMNELEQNSQFIEVRTAYFDSVLRHERVRELVNGGADDETIEQFIVAHRDGGSDMTESESDLQMKDKGKEHQT